MSGRQIEALVLAALAGAMATAIPVHLMWLSHYQAHLRADANSQLQASRTARAIEHRSARLSADIGTRVTRTTGRVHATTREVIRYVPQILTPDLVDRYPLSAGFVRVHDAAASGDVSGLDAAASGDDDAPSDIDEAEAATAIAYNYEAYHLCAARLSGLQDWARAQTELFTPAAE